MKNVFLLFLLFIPIIFAQCSGNNHPLSQVEIPVTSTVPSLDELSGDWMDVNTLCSFPSVVNFAGGVQSTKNLTAFRNLTFPPFSQGGWSCELLLDGKSLSSTQSMWHPCEVRRRTTVDDIMMESVMRMPFEQKGVLIRLTLENKSKHNRTLNLSMNGNGQTRQYQSQKWRKWGNERPNDSDYVSSVTDDGKILLIEDKSSPALAAYSFNPIPSDLKAEGVKGNIKWTLVLESGEKAKIEVVFVIGGDIPTVKENARKWASDFSGQFDTAKIRWEERWQASFIPGNKHFSGHFPTLITNDSKIRRVYYHGALVPLLQLRTALPFNSRCFITAGPQFANSLVYFWDSEMWANTWAMLEPKTMKDQLIKWLSLDIYNCYAMECLTGEGAGPWYAANDWSIFRCIEAYLSMTGDISFLGQVSNGKTILQHLDEIATYYEKRPLTKDCLLANYGGPENLLECSPSYIQGVPSLNAANVYMLRRVAEYYKKSGNTEHATELLSKADKLLPFVMSLYESGQGVWNALNTIGQKVPIRHCYDFVITGQALENDLSPTVKSEMLTFVKTELLTKTWMRAMSFKDPASAKSDRPDHGPMGSYDAWPPMTMDVMCRFGDFGGAVTFLRATEVFTYEGPWTQSHEFTGPDSRGYDPIVRIASRGGQDANEVCGASFAEVIIRSFFGFRPELSVNEPVLLSPETPRGFEGKLEHIPWHGKLYTIVSDEKGVHTLAE
jgi:hypothetical protein